MLEPIASIKGLSSLDLQETELMRLYQQTHDDAVFRELACACEAPLRAYFRAKGFQYADIEDLVQATLLKLFRASDGFDAQRPFHAWLLTIAHHTLVDSKRKKRLPSVSLGAYAEEGLEVPEPVSRELTAPAVLERKEERMSVRRALENLLGREGEAMRQRYLQDRELPEIAEALKVSEGYVRVMISRTIKLLREKFAPQVAA